MKWGNSLIMLRERERGGMGVSKGKQSGCKLCIREGEGRLVGERLGGLFWCHCSVKERSEATSL